MGGKEVVEGGGAHAGKETAAPGPVVPRCLAKPGCGSPPAPPTPALSPFENDEDTAVSAFAVASEQQAAAQRPPADASIKQADGGAFPSASLQRYMSSSLGGKRLSAPLRSLQLG